MMVKIPLQFWKHGNLSCNIVVRIEALRPRVAGSRLLLQLEC